MSMIWKMLVIDISRAMGTARSQILRLRLPFV